MFQQIYKILSNFDYNPLICDPTQILQIVIVFFLERGEEIKPWFDIFA